MLVSVLEEEEFNKIIDSINDYMDSDDFYKYYYNPLINGIHRLGGEKELVSQSEIVDILEDLAYELYDVTGINEADNILDSRYYMKIITTVIDVATNEQQANKEHAYTVLPILIFKEVSCNSYERYLEILNMTPEELEENNFLDKILKNND